MKPGVKFVVSPSPHIRDRVSVRMIMCSVILALIPAVGAGVYFFGVWVLGIVAASVLTAVLTEFAALRLMGRRFVMDGSAIVTGLLLALCLPPTVPIWIPVVGAAFAIGIGKCAFGGLGCNIFNPALVGRAFLMISWPLLMTTWAFPVAPLEAVPEENLVTGATPLENWQKTGAYVHSSDLFMGNVGGSIGETSALAILIGGIFLIAMRFIDWRTPLTYIGTVGALMFLLGQDPIFHILAGGLFLGAFFMATDYVTTPITGRGKAIFGLGAGIIVVAIRMFGGFPEGVLFSILIMNGFTPLIDRATRPRVYGTEARFLRGW
jgi:electron transport complex protein RnfD